MHYAEWRVFLLAFLVYAPSAQVWSHAVSLAPHYVYLADALLHRHVDLLQLPPVTYDLLQYQGRWFVAGSPMPALLMLPFVAIFGVDFSDVLFSVVLGAIDVALVYALLDIFRMHPERSLEEAKSKDAPRSSTPLRSAQSASSFTISESARRWITLLFAVGTPFWYLASLGTYWFTAQVVVVFFTLLATREALTKQRWFLIGLYLACASLARPTALFLAPFFLIIIFYTSRDTYDSLLVTRYSLRFILRLLRPLTLFSLALLLGFAAHFVYNYARFKSVTDFGYAYVVGAQNITSVYARYGGFNPRFAPCNLSVSLLSPPEVNGAVPPFITQACTYLLEGVNLADTSAPITPNPLGMSVFVVTPALLIVFASAKPLRARSRLTVSATLASSSDFGRSGVGATEVATTLERRNPVLVAAWIGLLTTLIPLWLYHNTGSLQFGWRYLFDAAPMWIILLAAGMQKVTRLKQGLILISIVINLWGVTWMFGKLNG